MLTDVVDFHRKLFLHARRGGRVPVRDIQGSGSDRPVDTQRNVTRRSGPIPGVVAVNPVQYAYVNVGSDGYWWWDADPGTVTPAFAAMEPSVRAKVEAGDGAWCLASWPADCIAASATN